MKGLLVLFLALPFSLFSQGEWNQWRFGNFNGLNFNTLPPVSISGCTMPCSGVPASVSDSSGSLCFYSNGNLVWNKNNVYMANGTGLNYWTANSQLCFSVQDLTDPLKYRLFTLGAYNIPPLPQGLYYSVIDMNLNGGLGGIVTGLKNIVVPNAQNTCNWMTATRDYNNKDIWLVVRSISPNAFLTYKISSTGIDPNPVLSNSIVTPSTQPLTGKYTSAGVIKISQDGKYLVTTYRWDSVLEVCRFNDQTGSVTPRFKVKYSHNNFHYIFNSVEFSRKSNYLYAILDHEENTPPSYKLLQFNPNIDDSTNFMLSSSIIDSSSTHSALQLACDGKIYLTGNFNLDSISVINLPDLQGNQCLFENNIIGVSNTPFPFPQFLQKYKAYLHTSGTGCKSDSINFSGDIWPQADTIRWIFGDPASGAANVSYLSTPSHLFSAPGTYTVELYVRHNDNRTDTTWRAITIYPSPAPFLGPDRTICVGSSTSFDAGFCTGCSYEWKNVGSGLIVGTNQTFFTGTSGIYCVNVTNGNGCIGKDTVQLITTPIPVVTNSPPLLKSICTGESTNIPLFGNEPGIMFHWTATLTSGNISGFTADSGLVINQILINNGAIAGVVTYHITPKIGDCAGTPVDYAVTVNIGDPVDVTISASVNAVCAGTLVTFTATAVNAGTSPVYQWQVNGVNAGSNAPTFAYAPANGNIVTCILTSSNTVCTSNNPATSNAITMVVNPIQPVSVNVSPSANPVCSGTTVNFTALPVNGGSNPSWQWKVNGLVVGSNVPAYAYVPVNGDAVTCTLTSNVQCPSGNPAISGTINMAVNPNLPVGVSIVASSNPFCAGSSVTYTASPVNGGTTPGYQWKVNGISAGTNNPVFVYSPSNSDVVTCSLLSSETCTSGNPALSNPITMVVNANLPAGITIAPSANPFCPGSSVTFIASPLNGGSTPSYQWKVNGSNTGSNSSTFIYNPVNNDSIRCIMTSNLSCVTGNPASSVKIIMSGTLAPIVSFTSCFDTVTTVGAKAFKLNGGIPLGGSYSGPGVNSLTSVFTPSSAGIGLKTISYTYTNVSSCSANKTKTILVQANPTFTCGNSFSDIRDGKSYPTVQIGTQCWMAANLNYGSILTSSQVQNDNCISEKYCYNNVTGNCTKYGGLYQWDEVMKYDDTPAGQGLCPPGWHVPTDSEWTTLFNFYQGNALAGKPLQDTILSGFKAQTSGVFYLNSSWSFNGFATLFWSSTTWSAVKAISHGMNIYDFSVSLYPSSRANAFPVRCARD